MAERCPKALLGVAVSGLSSLAVFYYGVSIDQDLLYHVDTLLAATPAPTITLEEMMPAAIPSVIESYLPDFVTDFIYDLFSGHNWSSCLSIVVLIYAVYSSLKRDYLIACQARWMDILEDGILKKARVFEEQERILKRNCHNKKKDDKQISDLKRELSDSKAKGKEDAGQICDLKEKLEAADTELRAVKLKERQNEISMLQKEITTATTVMDLENQLEAMIAGRDQIGGNQIGEMIDTITELQGDNTQLEAKASGLEHRVTTLEADNVSLRQSTRMAHDAIERHESTIDELRKKDGQQKCTLQRLNETIRTLEIEKTATATAAESASCRSQSIQEREDNLKIQHRRAIESLRASSNAHISSLEDQIAGNKRAMAEQKRTLAEYQGDLKRRNLTIGDLQDRIS
ncbi:MAG: hypothetical protein L6R42_008335, partial [Xanthoria sp. 1 TBL-2021]